MRRAALLASLLLLVLVGLGTAAYAGCDACLEGIVASRSGSDVTLRFVARAADESFIFPEAGTAVVMQVDGRRTKCLALGLSKAIEGPGFAVFTATFTAYGQSSHSGRVDIGGQIYEFNVPLDGSSGTLAVATDQTPLPRNRAVIVVTAAPTLAPAAPAPAEAGLELPSLVTEPAFLLGVLVIAVTVLGAYVDRRRSLARSLAA